MQFGDFMGEPGISHNFPYLNKYSRSKTKGSILLNKKPKKNSSLVLIISIGLIVLVVLLISVYFKFALASYQSNKYNENLSILNKHLIEVTKTANEYDKLLNIFINHPKKTVNKKYNSGQTSNIIVNVSQIINKINLLFPELKVENLNKSLIKLNNTLNKI